MDRGNGMPAGDPGRASLPAAKLIRVPNAPVESHFLSSQSRQRPEVFLYSLTFLGDGTNGTVIEAGGNGEKHEYQVESRSVGKGAGCCPKRPVGGFKPSVPLD